VDGLRLVAGEREVAFDHQALRDGRIRAEAELGRDVALVHVPAPRQRWFLAVEGDPAPRDRVVLERPPHKAGGHDRPPVVAEAHGPRLGELGHLGQLATLLPLRDGGQEADRNVGLSRRPLREGAQDCRRVDDRIRVRHGQHGAVAARRGRRRARGDGLLVLAAGRAEVGVRVDERRRQHEAVAVHDAVLV
jgi:hypothetical protein